MSGLIVSEPCGLKNPSPVHSKCITPDCDRHVQQGHFSSGYCDFCEAGHMYDKLCCGVCQNDTSKFRENDPRTCLEHEGYTLRTCVRPRCTTGRFYRHKECVCILTFTHLPPGYSSRGNDYCNACIPEMIELNKARFKAQHAELVTQEYNAATFREAVIARDARLRALSTIAEEQDATAEDYYPDFVVEVEHTLVVKVTETYKLPRSVREEALLDKATGKLNLQYLPENLRCYTGDAIPQELISAQRASAAYVKRVGEITLDN